MFYNLRRLKPQLNLSLLLILGFGFISNAQVFKRSDSRTDIPNSIVNIGVGIGPNYGLIGAKTVVGKKNTGLLVGLGFPDGEAVV